MKKIIFIYIALVGLSINAQTPRVGINTDKPLQTLDISGENNNKGTLRIATPGVSTGKSKVIPLTWTPHKYDANNNIEIYDSNDNLVAPNDGKMLRGSNETYKPFRIVNYEFFLDKTEEQKINYDGGRNYIEQDLINGVDLKIPTNKYTVIALDYALIDTDDDKPVFMRAMVTDGSYEGNWGQLDDTGTDIIQFGSGNNRGRIYYNGNLTDADGGLRTVGRNRLVSVAAPMIFTFKSGNTWKFHADYPRSTPSTFVYQRGLDDGSHLDKVYVKAKPNKRSFYDKDSIYKWNVTFLIIDNAFIKTHNEITINLNPNSDTGSSTVDAITGQ